MSQPIIKIDNVSKQYRLGVVGTGTLSHDLNRWFAKIRGKEDPTLKVGASNELSKAGDQFVWALKDINLDVYEGQVLGLIGKNGAGKSTLLKLLSRITTPTTGNIHLNGRIASLLEVGTGFHPELTGRENIYLNGAILGMNKKEIKNKFEEIVEFSGIAKYQDTPVKRYSSGMYVRLAFAVAAHLEPEILVVDEVLAVGDADFQKKALGKMDSISKSGRTVLFVSHNMGAVRRLCNRSVMMQQGQLVMDGNTNDVIEEYLSGGDAQTDRMAQYKGGIISKDKTFKLNSIRIVDSNDNTGSILTNDKDVYIKLNYELDKPIRNLRVIFTLYSGSGDEIFYTSDYTFADKTVPRPAGEYTSVCKIPGNILNAGKYYIRASVDVPKDRLLIPVTETITFTITELMYDQMGVSLNGVPKGIIHPKLEWEVNKHP